MTVVNSELALAQADVRRIYSGGWGGPAVSAVVWFAAGVVAERTDIPTGAAVLFLGGALLIFPANLLINRMLSGQADLPAGHPMRPLAMQTAATMSVVLLALWLVSPSIPEAFFPLAMVAVGAHYFPFAHLYGERAFLVAGAVQCSVGLLLLVVDAGATLGAYAMTALLALTATSLAQRDRARTPR